MRKCNKCNIEFNGNFEMCPLCNSRMTGKKTDNVFPKIKTSNPTLLYKVLSFVSFAIGVLFAFTEYIISKSFYINKFVVLGLVTNYILVKFILKNYKDVLKMMNKYFLIILILFFTWFLATKSLIITTYLIPILCIIIFVFNSITMLVLKNPYIIKFVKTILLDCLIGLIPLILVVFKLTTFEILSYICAILGLLAFVGLLIFCKEDIIEEFKKVFNF